MARRKGVSAADDATGFWNEGDDGVYEDRADDDDEDDDGPDAYERDGFIVDDVEEEDEEDNCGERLKKKKKKRDAERSYLLDEEDYELLQESNISVPRPNLNKKLKRLKKAQGDTKEESSQFSGERQYNGSGKGWRTAEERLKYSLFGDDDGQSLEDIDDEDGPQENQDIDIAEEDEMADFIVDEDQVDKHGALISRKKQPRSMQQSGIPSSALQEAHEIFGDVEDLLKIRKLGMDTFGEAGERSLEDQFDPSELSEKYMTGKDDQIRKIDVPERIQMYEESTGLSVLDEISIEMESEWICNQFVSGAVPFYSKSAVATEGLGELKGHIAKFLELMHVHKLDVPFIAMYRKEEILGLLKDPDDPEAYLQADPSQKPKLRRHKVLWTIRDLDQKWLILLKRKGTLQTYYTKRFEEETRRVYDKTKLNLNQQLFESITMLLKAANSESEVDDVDTKFSLHFPPDEVVLDEGLYKRPKRKSHYSICSKAGLWEVANRFGYSSEQFGLQISLEKMRMDELEDAKEAPEEMASNFTSMMFETSQAVLKGARHMAAVEISCEPSVRKHVRSIFMDNAVVSTRPTPDGNATIHSSHQFSGVKWLRDKPLGRFEDAQWLLIQKAEEEKLLQVTIKLPEAVLDKLLSDSRDYYLSDGVSKSAQSWNEQRKQILQEAFHNILLPSMEKEARSWLTSRAKTWLLEEYGNSFWDKVSVAPYQRKANDISSNEEAAPRVLACCWGPGKPATTFVMLNSSGEIEDVLNAGCLNLRGQSVNDLQRKKNDQQRVQKFMMDHQPHVVVLGAANMSCTRLKEDIYEIIFKLVEDNPRDCHKIDSLNIVYGDESLPRLYENSRISVDQLPLQEGIIRRAVALGRYLQNPLAVAATLCGPGREILSWKLNPLEKFLTPDEKYGMVEQLMIDATNQVGLDMNLASNHEWLFSPLQFISGLGPRKAASLQRSLGRAGAIFTRKDLLISHGLGKKVFVNAVGFLRVRRSGLSSSSSQFIDLLDDTRIHPESYGLAQDLAKDVYREAMNNEVNDGEDDDLLEMAIEHVRENPHLLTAVDVHEYAEQKNRQSKKETLNDIRLELMNGFQDWRKSHVEPNQDDEFYMIAGEAEETLAEGRIVQATVRRVQEDRAICNLDSGLTGIVSKEDYTDDWRDINELTDKLHEGDILTCRIKFIQKNRYQVFLTCRESEMRSNRFQNNQIEDPYFHEECSTLQPKQEIAHREKELSKKLFKPRMIVHPRFKNITADETLEFLRDKEAGESVIRPSLRGPSYLTLTLKVCDGVFANKDIVEGQKELKDITSLLRIGKTLKIGDDTFEDLDEVMDRYVDPLKAHLKTMLNYRKFRMGTKTDIDELLRIEKAKIPTKIVYSLGVSYDHPGTFILTYIRSASPHHEYIGLYPKGFKFRKRMFEKIDRLVAYFQKHIDDPRSSGPTIQSAAAMMPTRSLAAGDHWGGSNNDGDQGGSQSMDGASGLGSRGGRGDSQNGGRGRGRGRGRGSYGDGRPEKQDFDRDSQKWGSNNDKGSDWGGGASGSTGVGGGSKGDDNCGGGGSAGGWGRGGSGNTGGWGGSGGGTKSDSNWGGGGSGGAGSWGGGGAQSESGGGWGSGKGGDRSGSAGGQGGAGDGTKSDSNWGVGGSGGAGSWRGGGDQSESGGGWGGGKGGDRSGSAGGQGGAGGGTKSDSNWGGGGSGGAGSWGGGGDRSESRGGWGGGKGGDRSGSAGGQGGAGDGTKNDSNWGGGVSGGAGSWGGGGDQGESGGGWSGGKVGDRSGSAGGQGGGWGGTKSDSNRGGGGSGGAGNWGGGGDQSESGGGWGGGKGGDRSGSTGGQGGSWGGGSNNRGTSGTCEGIGSGSTGGWGGDVNHKSAGGGDRGSGWGSGGGWKGGGRDSAGGDWGGSHDASGGTKGGGSWGEGRGASTGGRGGQSGGTGGWRGGSSSRSTGGSVGGTGSGSTSGWGGGRGSTGGRIGGHDNTGTDWGSSHSTSAGTEVGGSGWGGSQGVASGGSKGGSAGWGGGGGAGAWGGGGSGSASACGASANTGGWVGSGSGAWGDGGSSNAGGGNASAGGWGSCGGSESAGGGNAGGWGSGNTKKESEGGWGQGGK